MTDPSTGSGTGLPVVRELGREECLRLLATASLGRVVYTRAALPAVEPVAFRVRGHDIVFRTRSGAVLAGVPGAVVAFQADDVDPATWTGWSVVAVGEAREVPATAPPGPEPDGGRTVSIRAQRLTGWAAGR